MIEGLILLTELVLFLLLLLAVKRASVQGAPQNLGLFSYKVESDEEAPGDPRQKPGGRRSA